MNLVGKLDNMHDNMGYISRKTEIIIKSPVEMLLKNPKYQTLLIPLVDL